MGQEDPADNYIGEDRWTIIDDLGKIVLRKFTVLTERWDWEGVREQVTTELREQLENFELLGREMAEFLGLEWRE